MGNIAPIASQAVNAFQTANKIISVIRPVANVIGRGIDFFDDDSTRSELTAKQLQDSQRIQEQQAAQKVSLEKQEILVKAQDAEKKRREALKRAVSRQRARFGSSGVTSNGGSSEAVLLGLFEESDTEKQQRERLDSLKTSALDQGLSQQRRVNTLQRQQLQQSQKLKRQVSPLEAAKSFFDIF